jgi:dTDP-4-amino-4,6-dideoxygalactose transaminase
VTPIPFNDLRIRGTPLESGIRDAIARVVDSAWFVLGREVEAFERELAEALGVETAVGVGNGTDAISLALESLGVGPGDEVVTSPLTAAFTALAVSRIGATPIFADVEPDTLSLSPESVEERITERTRAILPVHLYGNACDMDRLMAVAAGRGLVVVEDACQAHGGSYAGRPLGGIGDAGAFSFYPTKNLGALGDGGMVVTRDPDLAERVRRLRNGGQSSRYRHELRGVNSRLDEIQAAVLRVKLPHLETWNEKRRALAASYDRALEGTLAMPVRPREGSVSARHLYVVRTPERDGLMRHLEARGIQSLIHYPVPTHLQPAYADASASEGSCPIAEDAARSIVSLPLYPSMTEADVRRVAAAVRDFEPA